MAGDFVKVELDRELFKIMHEAAGLWNDRLSVVRRLYFILYKTTSKSCLHVNVQS